MDKKAWVIFSIIVAAVVGGMVYLSMQQRLDVSDISKDAAAKILPAEARNGSIGDHVHGNKDAKVVLVEYADFQCPGCATAAPEAKRVTDKYKQHVALVFRNYPLTQMHPNARAAAAVAEAAGLQGKFWQMHDLIFTNQKALNDIQAKERTELFLGYARKLGLDEARFNKDIAAGHITKKIDFDVAIGKLQGVVGTPSFYVNGQAVSLNDDKGNAAAGAIEKAVKAELIKQGIKVE